MICRVNPHVRAGGLWEHERVARTIVLVDDHADFRAHATVLLEAAGYEVVGSCPDGRSALTAIAELRPDVVLLDVQLPDIDGFSVIEQVDGRVDGPIVVLISTRDAADYGARVARSGAAGFISKEELSARSLAQVVSR
jgi:two-component system chemotaxis response regulator CheY